MEQTNPERIYLTTGGRVDLTPSERDYLVHLLERTTPPVDAPAGAYAEHAGILGKILDGQQAQELEVALEAAHDRWVDANGGV